MASSNQPEKEVMLVAIDDSEHSSYALKWTLDHFFINDNPVFKLVLLHARPSATSAVGIAGPVYTGAAELLPIVDADLTKIAARVTDDAKQLCLQKSFSVFLYGHPHFVLIFRTFTGG